MVQSKFCGVPTKQKSEFMLAFTKVIHLYGANVDPAMEKTYVSIVNFIIDHLIECYDDPKRLGINPQNDVALCSEILDLALQLGDNNYATAKKIFRFCSDDLLFDESNYSNLQKEVFMEYVTAMIEKNEVDEAYKGVLFLHQLDHTREAEMKAKDVGEKLDLNDAQKSTLNRLFYSNSKWIMLR